jgi:phospholipase/lecithinase/hemolysin
VCRLIVFVALMGGAAIARPVRAAAPPDFRDVVIFGDSLSDSGNLYEDDWLGLVGLFGGVDWDDYPTGRFSNGPVWSEYFGAALDRDTTALWSDGGDNYAYAGATTDDGGVFLWVATQRNLGNQVEKYLESRTPGADDLFVLWGGANDIFDNLTINITDPVSNLDHWINDLADAGARSFLIPNLPPLGAIPRYRTTSDAAAYNAITVAFNTALDAQLDVIRTQHPDVTIYELDVYGLFLDMLADPQDYGFTNITTPGLTLGVNHPMTGYLFYDDIHPTTAGHYLLAQYAAAAVPEPAAVVALLLVWTALPVRPRRCRRLL